MNDDQPQSPSLPKYPATPQLLRRPEFEAALKNYTLNLRAHQLLQGIPFVFMTGPTSVGRNTIIRELLKTGHYYFLISDTTRPPRLNHGVLEQHGQEYFFRTEDDMLADVQAGRFIEAEIIHGQQVSGVSIREIEKAHEQNKIVISDIDIIGAINISRLKPDAVAISLLPPSFDEWLNRIKSRTAVEPDEFYRRLQTATKVFKLALENDNFIFVVNDDLQATVKTVDEIARFGRHNAAAEQQARVLAQRLYRETSEYLRKNAPHLASA